ncbi:MarR family transcriptional regulator [Brachybacterium sp. J144]|uniref:MarR family winged helix-turn-helix transcriptional regulator n=1 Tax=Brachybacterium sp. J144 TaxID=3116487 RepID=UPI002E79800E|nr:MarR family transcriptional regulator [Brachybacterium sp. J144]MEE1652149.1 MarR family transcriptional regulator [Brachybacterium sp. J144]
MGLAAKDRLGVDVKSTEVALMAAKAEALRPFGLSVAQYAVLLTLRDHPGISGAGIARACLVTPQATAATLKVLEEKSLLTRALDDWNRASRPARLTAEGERVVAAADAAASAIEQRVHDALTSQQRAALRHLLGRCREAIER